MLTVTSKHRIFLAVEPISFRKGIDGIAAICREKYLQDPTSGHYFIFCNRRKNSIKAIYFDGQGFWLFQKRLSSGRFMHWPKRPEAILQLNSAQLQVLLSNGNPAMVEVTEPWKPIDND